jgi:hypothetical protein
VRTLFCIQLFTGALIGERRVKTISAKNEYTVIGEHHILNKDACIFLCSAKLIACWSVKQTVVQKQIQKLTFLMRARGVKHITLLRA